MAHSPGYPTDNNRQPDRKERSWEKQRGSRCGSWDKEAPRLGKRDLYIRCSNTKYNNYFNLIRRINNVLKYITARCTSDSSALTLKRVARRAINLREKCILSWLWVWVSESRQLELFLSLLRLFMISNNLKKYGNRCEKLDGRYSSVRKMGCIKSITSISSARSSSEHVAGKHLTPITPDTMGGSRNNDSY